MDVILEIRRAHDLARCGDNEGAKAIYLQILEQDPGHFDTLIELGRIAWETGDRTTSLVAFSLAVQHRPENKIAHVQLANFLTDDGAWVVDDSALAVARHHYAAALSLDPEFVDAHQGMAWVMMQLGHPNTDHWIKGFVGHATKTRRYLGIGSGIPLILLVSARGGNVPVRHWIDERIFEVTVVYADFFDTADSLPSHRLVVNAIGDSDFAYDALVCAEKIVQTTTSQVINEPSLVRLTGREENATRIRRLDGVVTPRIIRKNSLSDFESDPTLIFPLLLRSPGFHGGKKFVRLEKRSLLNASTSELNDGDLFVIEYLDACGPDGFWRKYRVMAIDGKLYPLHLAISADWKVHYFSSSMAENPEYRAEEQKFLQDMPGVLGPIAMAALADIAATIALDFCGIDFALAQDGRVLLFEANATMAIVPAEPDPIWDYRRPKLDQALSAARAMVLQRLGLSNERGGR